VSLSRTGLPSGATDQVQADPITGGSGRQDHERYDRARARRAAKLYAHDYRNQAGDSSDPDTSFGRDTLGESLGDGLSISASRLRERFTGGTFDLITTATVTKTERRYAP